VHVPSEATEDKDVTNSDMYVVWGMIHSYGSKAV